MARNDVLTEENLKGVHILAYSYLFGMSVWITFIGGTIAHKTLTRQQFSALQHRSYNFPVHYGILTVMSIILLGSLPDVVGQLLHPEIADVSQVYAIGSVLLMHILQLLVLGPLTSKITLQRFEQEKSGKDYTNPAVSDETERLNEQFAQVHGWSLLANLLTVFALVYHGLWICNFKS